MTAENLAKFTINGDASVDPVTGNKGYQAAALDVLTLTLEQSPSTVLSVTYSVYDSSSDDSPLASKDAPLLTFTGSGTSSDSPATINGSVELIMPATAAHSWNVRCVVSHSDGPQEYVRQIDIPYSLAGIDIFKSVPGETDEFYARSWSDKFNDYMTYIAAFTVPTLDQSYDAGGAGLGRAVTVDSGAIEFTGSNAADYTLELTNSAAGGVLYVNNTGTGLTVNFRDGGANVFNIADGGDFDLDSADFDLHATGNVTIDSDGAIDIDAAISLDIDCSAGSIGLGTTPVNHPINIGTSGVRKVTVGNASATEVQIDALLVDINAGATGFTVDGAGASSIDVASANLSISTTTAGNLSLTSAAYLILSDGYQSGSTYGTDLVLSDASAEWDTFETNFGEVSILNALNQCASSAVTLDEAYNASAGASTISVDAGDLTWNEVGAFSFIVGLSGCTGAADGFFVEDGTDYFRLTHGAANTLNLSTALNMATVSVQNAITIDSTAAGVSIDGVADSNVSITDNSVNNRTLTISAVNTGAGKAYVDVYSDDETKIRSTAGAVLIDSATSLELNSSAGAINIGNDAVAQPISIGTGAAARTITIGNATGATAVDLKSGTGGINLHDGVAQLDLDGAGALTETALVSADITPSGTLTLRGGGISQFGDDTGYFAFDGGGSLSTSGITKIVISSSSTIDIDATGALSLDAGDNSNFTVTTNSALDKELIIHLENTSTGEGAIGIVSGDRACTSDHFVGISAVGGAGSSVLIGADGTISLDSALVDINAGATGMTVDSGATIDIDATGALSLNSSAGVINIGNDAVNQNINIGTGVSARTITIGQISGTSTSEVEFNADTIDINSDAGGISLVASTGDILLETSAAPALDITIQATGDIDFLANGSVGTSFNEADSGVLTRLALDGFTASSIIGGMNELHSNIQEIHTLAAATLSFNDTSVTSIHVSYTGTGAVTITVDSDQIAIAGRTFTIKDTGLNAAANSITVETEGAEEIEGEANLVMAVDGMSITLQSDGSNLWII